MSRHVGKVQKERLFLVLLHELDCAIGDQIVDVSRYRDPLPAVPKLCGKLLPGVDGVGIAEELVESLVHRMDVIRLCRPRGLPWCHLPKRAVVYPSGLSASAIVTSSVGKSSLLRRTPEWIVYFPVKNDARLGAQTTAAV